MQSLLDKRFTPLVVPPKYKGSKVARDNQFIGVHKLYNFLTQRLVIEEDISFQDFKEHRARIEAERANLKSLVEIINSRQTLVKADFEIALQLASELDFLFEKGDNDERRLLCETVFKRVNVRDGKIVSFDLNSPFRLIASRAEGSESFLSGQPAMLFTSTTTAIR